MLSLLLIAAALQTPAARTVMIVDEAFKGPPTELMVLGTAHLNELGPRFTREQLTPLIVRLNAWKPAVITVENPTGRDCDDAAGRPDLFGNEVDEYCRVAASARTAATVNQPGAEAAIDAILAEPAADRPPADRRRLATLFLAAGDPGSALVQWLRLPPGEQRADALLPEALVARLERYAASRNETYALAARVAAGTGLERLHPVDDYSAGRLQRPYTKAYSDRITAIWNNAHAKSAEAERKAAYETLLNGGDILAFYRWINDPQTLAGQLRADFAAAAADRAPEQIGRRYLAYWETRNLRMVANIRHAFGNSPGVRVLAIVGNSHKPYFERYFATQTDVQIADVTALLR